MVALLYIICVVLLTGHSISFCSQNDIRQHLTHLTSKIDTQSKTIWHLKAAVLENEKLLQSKKDELIKLQQEVNGWKTRERLHQIKDDESCCNGKNIVIVALVSFTSCVITYALNNRHYILG